MMMNLRTYFQNHNKEVIKSVKLLDIEEKFDIYFSRFFGLFFAKWGRALSMTPTQVSVASLIVGVAGGILFYFQDQVWIVVIGCLLVTLAGILDSADGQLARMTGTSSELGRKIDVIIDTFVFVACYWGGCLYFLDTYGWWLILYGHVAGYLHSAKSANYEFYKTEYLYYITKFDQARIPTLEEVKTKGAGKGIWNRILYWLEIDYIRKQANTKPRSQSTRELFEEQAFGENKVWFEEVYKKYNKPLMIWWALICGTNIHRSLMMFFALLGRFDIYVFVCIGTYLPMLILNRIQENQDKKIVELINERAVAA